MRSLYAARVLCFRVKELAALPYRFHGEESFCHFLPLTKSELGECGANHAFTLLKEILLCECSHLRTAICMFYA